MPLGHFSKQPNHLVGISDLIKNFIIDRCEREQPQSVLVLLKKIHWKKVYLEYTGRKISCLNIEE